MPGIAALTDWLSCVEESILVATWARLNRFRPLPINNLAIAAEFAYRSWCYETDSGKIHGEPIAGIPVLRWVVGETGENDLAQAIGYLHELWLGDKLRTKPPPTPLMMAWHAKAWTVPAMRPKRKAWVLVGCCTRCGGGIDGDSKHCKRETNCRKARSVPEPVGWMLARALAALLEVFATCGDADSETDRRALVAEFPTVMESPCVASFPDTTHRPHKDAVASPIRPVAVATAISCYGRSTGSPKA